MAPPRSETRSVRGWRVEFRLWWKMAKHVDVVFDKSPQSPGGPGSISMCRNCCQILSTRNCLGETTETALGCDFHRRRPEVPIAVKSTITSQRLREMWKPSMTVESYYLEPKAMGVLELPGTLKVNLMTLPWVRQMRVGNRETKRSKKVYVHSDAGCVHSSNPESIVQGLGPKHIYFKRCDGKWINAFGEQLNIFMDNAKEDGSRQVSTELSVEGLTSDVAEVSESRGDEAEQPESADPVPQPVSAIVSDTIIEPEIEDFNDKVNPWLAVDMPKPETEELESANLSEPTSPLDIISKAINDSAISLSGRTPSRPASLTPTSTELSISTLSEKTFLMPWEYLAKQMLLPDPPALPVELNFDPAKLAEMAWQRNNMRKAVDEVKELKTDEEARRRRKKRWWKIWKH